MRKIFSLLALIISAVSCGIITTKIYPNGGLGFCATVALAITLIMMLCGVIVTVGKLSAGSFLNYFCYFGSFTLSSYIGRKMSDGKKHRRHKR